MIQQLSKVVPHWPLILRALVYLEIAIAERYGSVRQGWDFTVMEEMIFEKKCF